MAFLRHILFCLSDVSLQRYDFADFGKNNFSHSWQLYTVIQDEYELRKAAHVFGWCWGIEGGPAYVGWPSIKISLVFETFFRITKS
jgi:hypothetical protein